MIFEIRNYYFEPSRFDEYKRWAKTQAIHYLKRNLNVIGFWVNAAPAPEVLGEPMDRLGSANITWIIGWDDIAQREAVMAKVFATPEWQAIFKHVPGGIKSYIRRESKFTESLL